MSAELFAPREQRQSEKQKRKFMAKIDIIEFRDEQAFDLVVKPMSGPLKRQNGNINSILIRFPNGSENACQVSRCFNYGQQPNEGMMMMTAARRHENRPPRGVPVMKPWRPCRSAGESKK